MRDARKVEPPGEPPADRSHTGQVTTLYAYVSTSPDGEEHMLAVPHEQMGLMPLCSGCRNCIERMRPYAEMIAQTSGMQVRLVHWTTRTTLDLLGTVGSA